MQDMNNFFHFALSLSEFLVVTSLISTLGHHFEGKPILFDTQIYNKSA